MTPSEYFGEMSPLFCTTDVPHTVIGQHMQQFAESRDIKVGTKRLLIGGMAANKMAIISPLLKWYMEMGLEVIKVYQVIEYTPVTFISARSKHCPKSW